MQAMSVVLKFSFMNVRDDGREVDSTVIIYLQEMYREAFLAMPPTTGDIINFPFITMGGEATHISLTVKNKRYEYPDVGDCVVVVFECCSVKPIVNGIPQVFPLVVKYTAEDIRRNAEKGWRF